MITAKTAGFRFLPSYYEAIRELPDAQRLALYDALLDFGFGNEPGELPPLLNGFFCLMRPNIEKSQRYYEAQKANGAKGGRPGKDRAKPNENPNETQLEVTVVKPENRDSDCDSENESESEYESESEGESVREGTGAAGPRRAARFTPPTIEDVDGYCREAGIALDAARFVDFYASKGWRVGREGMKDWKAAVRNWERREDCERGSRSGTGPKADRADPRIRIRTA